MATIKSIYAGDLRTEAQHIASGKKIITDAPVDNNGRGEAFSPTDLVCAALGSCMMTLMGILAQRENINLEGTSYEITKHMAASPRKIKQIDITFIFPPISLTETQQTKLKNAALTCPVALSLHPEVEQNVVFVFQPNA